MLVTIMANDLRMDLEQAMNGFISGWVIGAHLIAVFLTYCCVVSISLKGYMK